MFYGRRLLKTWCKQQTVVATSSAEAELYAASKAISEAIAVQSLLSDLGVDAHVHVYTDSSSALSLIQRTGLGKAKHIDVHRLWLQDQNKSKKVAFSKVAGDSNPADLMTKGMGGERIQFLSLLGYQMRGYHSD